MIFHRSRPGRYIRDFGYSNRIGLALLILVLPSTLIGCSQQGGGEVSACKTAFDQLPAIDPVEGMYVVVSEGLAGTLSHCADIPEWESELVAHPGAVGTKDVERSDLNAYLAGACSLLPESGEGTELCDQGRSQGLFK